MSTETKESRIDHLPETLTCKNLGLEYSSSAFKCTMPVPAQEKKKREQVKVQWIKTISHKTYCLDF